MDDSSKDPDRAILESPKAGWTHDPERTLTEVELDRLLRLFGEFRNTSESELRPTVGWLFRSFMGMALEERVREGADRLEPVPKPSTIVARQMKEVKKACEKLDAQLGLLDPATRIWLDQYLKETAADDKSGHRVRLRHLEERITHPINQLIHAAHEAEGLASPGPNNMAQRIMVEGLAGLWENCHGKPPTTDKGRGRRDDPFLELCQEMSGIAHARLQKKGSGFSILELSGLVNDVLKKRRSQSAETPREK